MLEGLGGCVCGGWVGVSGWVGFKKKDEIMIDWMKKSSVKREGVIGQALKRYESMTQGVPT